ncbi:hypothetical protein Y1U_C1205 [Streptococcus thermophilus MN-ZLW-002]|nr:hypothetical protein Y1U_C1205 [Streptococcus thermophilus MN-ZLW-002]KPL38085.1 hypothetical protein ADU38_181 [Streptococcus thermophilus]
MASLFSGFFFYYAENLHICQVSITERAIRTDYSKNLEM